ncbi:MAG: sensor domain-containing diguanylate cyclase [Nitrospirota bacterium]
MSGDRTRSSMNGTGKRIFAYTAAIGAFVWFGDAAIDALVFGNGSFLESALFDVSAHELFMRSFPIIIYSAAAVVLALFLLRRREADRELRKHLTAIESSMDGVAIFDRDHIYRYVNEAYARVTGFGKPEAMLGKPFSLIYDEQQLAWIGQNIFPALDREGRWHGEMRAHRKDGTVFEQEASITRLEDDTCVCVMRDVTERKRRDEEVRHSERFLNTIFDSIRDPFCIIDRNYTIVRANAAYSQLKNRTIDELIDRTCYQALEGKDEVCDGCIIRKTLQSSDPCAKEKKVTLKNGDTLWLEIFTYPIMDEAGRISHVIEYTRDVTDRKKSEEDRRRLIERLEYLSQIDGLTGLLNRRALTDQLEYEVDRARRYGSELSVILCDLDNLKEINDTHGHIGGDTTLQLLSATIRSSLRNADIAGRYGGDEFLVIVPQTSLEGAASIAEKVRAAAERAEVKLDGGKIITLSLSIGVAALANPPEGMDGLVSRVDAALYASKNTGRNKVTVAP